MHPMGSSNHVARALPSVSAALHARPELARPRTQGGAHLIGLLEGSGIGPQLLEAALQVLEAVQRTSDLRFELRRGGLVGDLAESRGQAALPADAIAFCAGVFNAGGAILSGPAGGRYVYDLRREFDLFCKFVPIQPVAELADAGRLRAAHVAELDILIVRENSGGIYQGSWSQREGPRGRVAEHVFQYDEAQVRRIVEVAARAAAGRRKRLHVISKEGGVPAISALWRELGLSIAEEHGVQASAMNVDLAVYEIVQNPRQFDVIVAPNLMGDIVADVAGVLVASRGLTYSGNYDARGCGVYQTNHGCAHDLAGRDIANPAGHLLALAMLLRESFGLSEAASSIEQALRRTWRAGWRTADVAAPGCRVVGTRAMAELVANAIYEPAELPSAR